MKWVAVLVAVATLTADVAVADGKSITLVNERSAVEHCHRLDQLQSKSYWGGFAATGLAYNRAMASLKKQAADRGATHILIISISNTVGGTNMIGDAYACPAEGTSAPPGPS